MGFAEPAYTFYFRIFIFSIVKFCFFGFLNGHAAAAGGALAACGSDGRAACRVRPAMLMLGHGERLAVAIVAVAALDVNVVLIALVYGQPGDCERLALLAGMRCSINF